MVYVYISNWERQPFDCISVLKEITDKYKYEDMVCPATYNSIDVFAERNQVCVFIYAMDPETNDTSLSKPGKSTFLNNDLVYRLRIDSEEQSHYIYIKSI